MDRIQRIEMVVRCAERLPQGRSGSEVDFILRQFDLPTQAFWRSSGGEADPRVEYVRDMLTDPDGARDDRLEDLDRYLAGDAPVPVEDLPWDSARFRLFLSHVAAKSAFASDLKRSLAYWGIDAFVAHEDIEPGREWSERILSALRTCDALLAVLQDGFRESDWCDQEVGIALGRAIPVLSLKIDLSPYGFFGFFQAVATGDRATADLVREVAILLHQHPRTAGRMTEAMVDAIRHSITFDMTNDLSYRLTTRPEYVTWVHLETLREAHQRNSQVSRAWYFENNFDTLASRLGAPPLKPAQNTARGDDYGYDEDPF